VTPHRTLHRFSGWLFALPYLLLFGGFLILPLLYGLRLSFFRWEMLSPAPPRFIGLDNYREAFGDPYFRKALGVTLWFVALSVPLTVGVALLIATGLYGVPRRRQTFYRAAYFLPTMLTISVAGLLWRWFYNDEFGLFNAYLSRVGIRVPWLTNANWAMLSIVFMSLWWTVGGPMIILLAGLQDIPDHYLEAAEIDGATAQERFRYIMLPLLRPVLLFTLVLNIIGAFQVFGQTFMITRGGPEFATRSLVYYIYDTAFNNYRMGYAAAISWLLFLLIGVFSVVQFRLMREK
jgi:multiple sugar transport system permease protein